MCKILVTRSLMDHVCVRVSQVTARRTRSRSPLCHRSNLVSFHCRRHGQTHRGNLGSRPRRRCSAAPSEVCNATTARAEGGGPWAKRNSMRWQQHAAIAVATSPAGSRVVAHTKRFNANLVLAIPSFFRTQAAECVLEKAQSEVQMLPCHLESPVCLDVFPGT